MKKCSIWKKSVVFFFLTVFVFALRISWADYVPLSEAIRVLHVCAGMSEESPDVEDVNGDDKIGLEEAIYILSKVAGLRTDKIHGYVIGGSESTSVKLCLSDGTEIIRTTANSDGFFEIELYNDDMLLIDPEIPEGSDGPKDNLLIVAEKDGKTLRNAVNRDVNNDQAIYISRDTEAYALYLESINQLDTVALSGFNDLLENGKIKDGTVYTEFIRNMRDEVDAYLTDGTKPSSTHIFNEAIQYIGKEKVSEKADESSILLARDIMSGGDILLPSEYQVSSDDITITDKGNGRYRIGTGNESDQSVYLSLKSGEIFKLLKLNVKAQQTTQLASATVTPHSGAVLEEDSFGISIPPFATDETRQVSFDKIDSDGETSDGKVILDMQPSGLSFEVPATVKVRYPDFGVDDPNDVQWLYGSVNGGYRHADIINIDRENKLIYLSIEHFSELIVRKIKGKKFLDLGHNFVVVIPNRNKKIGPSSKNEEFIKLEAKVITNKLFEGMSTSSLNGNGTVGGGQCVQFAKNFYYPFKIGKKLKISEGKIVLNRVYKGYKPSEGLPDGVRENLQECREGDVVALDVGTHGHIAIFKERTPQISFIQSNYLSHDLNMSPPYPNYKGWHERFSIGGARRTPTYAITTGADDQTHITRPTESSYTFMCFDPEYFSSWDYDGHDFKVVHFNSSTNVSDERDPNTTSGYKDYNTTSGNTVCTKPWMYYLVSEIKDGIEDLGDKGDKKEYKYKPELLPVSPIKVSYDEDNNGTIASYEDMRYEIYIEDETESEKNESSFKTKNFEGFQDNSVLYFNKKAKLLFSDSEKYMYRLESANSPYFFNNVSEFKMYHEASNNGACLTSTKKVPVLFSPTVIDDYYVEWKGDIKTQQTKKPGEKEKKEKTDKDLRIGFWSSCGYNLEYRGEYAEGERDNNGNEVKLDSGCIYKSEDALNGYFMTLGGKDKKVQWHFSLAGYHSILVHLPGGFHNQDNDLTYKLCNNNLEKFSEVTTLNIKQTSLGKLNQSSFDDWYILYALYEDKEGVTKKKYFFNLTGKEHLELEGKEGKVYKIDAIRLQSVRSVFYDVSVLLRAAIHGVYTVNGSFNFNASLHRESSDANSETRKAKRDSDSSSSIAYEKILVQKSESGDFEFNGLEKGKYKVVVNTSATGFKPQTVYFEVTEENQTIRLPQISLVKNDIKAGSLKLRVFDTTDSTIVPDADISIRFGVDKESGKEAYKGTTDSEGFLEIHDVPYGQYTVFIDRFGYMPVMLDWSVNDDTADTIEFPSAFEEIYADPNLKECINATLGLEPDANPTREEYESITDLDCYNQGIKDIKNIDLVRNLRNLNSLHIGDGEVADISALKYLTNLTKLEFYSNQISDISVLAGLTNLTWLNFSFNQISEISVLADLTNLTMLGLRSNHISDISVLAGLTKLTTLYLDSNQISDISALVNLINLDGHLLLAKNQITDISALSYLKKVTLISIESNNIKDISPLCDLINLTWLMAWGNQITDISRLSNLTNLTNLNLNDNQIANIAPLSNLTSLTSLYLEKNQIANIAPLSNLTSLTSLHLEKNQIANIAPLSNLTNLTQLDLDDNLIADISALGNIAGLRFLSCKNNWIGSISVLQNLNNLEYIYLNGNCIKDFTPIVHVPNIYGEDDQQEGACAPSF